MARRRMPGASMLILATILLLSTVAVDHVSVNAQSTGDSRCQDVHLFLARGDGEQYPGRIGDLAAATCGQLPSCDYEDIAFTSIDGSIYCDSLNQGANNGVSQIYAYHKKCPKAKLVLGGYSLGANVVGDVLGGGGGNFYDCSEDSVAASLAPNSAPGNMIAAAAIFGDVRHVANQSYTLGTGAVLNGQYPRSGMQLSNLNRFADKMHSYCLSTDPICALGNDGLSHTTYMTVFAANASAWIVSMLNGFVPSTKIIPLTTSTTSSIAYSTSTAMGSSASGSSAASTSSTSAMYTPFRFDAATTASTASTAASQTNTPSATPSSTPEPPLSTAAIAGFAAGGVALLGSIAGLIYCLTASCRRRRSKEGSMGFPNPPTSTDPAQPLGTLQQNLTYSRVEEHEQELALALTHAAQMRNNSMTMPLPSVVHDRNRNGESNGMLDPMGRYHEPSSPGLSPPPGAPWEQQHTQRTGSPSYEDGYRHGGDGYGNGYGNQYAQSTETFEHGPGTYGGGEVAYGGVYGNGYGNPYARSTETLGLGSGMYSSGEVAYGGPYGYSRNNSGLSERTRHGESSHRQQWAPRGDSRNNRVNGGNNGGNIAHEQQRQY